MQKRVKRALVGTAIALLLPALFFGGYMWKAKTEVKKMSPLETGEVAPGIFALKDAFVNMYLIRDDSTYIAIDAGNSTQGTAAELAKLGIAASQVKAVFLTHTDGDHVGALALFSQAKIYLSSQEEEMIDGTKSRFLIFKNRITLADKGLVGDQQTLLIGNIRVKGLLTPGHTPGSMCFQVNDSCLFTGDALSLKFGHMDKFNTFFNMDTDRAMQSMAKLKNLHDISWIFTAHYGLSHNFAEAVSGL
ncbi:MAG: MBL fold metallo-hydrolase [Bacteroidales bacterium]|nr:MBL fold metallo-hydrolase [Bacteroidales bacterium]